MFPKLFWPTVRKIIGFRKLQKKLENYKIIYFNVWPIVSSDLISKPVVLSKR